MLSHHWFTQHALTYLGIRRRQWRTEWRPEQLNEDDEDRFQTAEEQDEKRAKRDDSSYYGSSGSEG